MLMLLVSAPDPALLSNFRIICGPWVEPLAPVPDLDESRYKQSWLILIIQIGNIYGATALTVLRGDRARLLMTILALS